MKILVVDHHKATQAAITQLMDDSQVFSAVDAGSAVLIANEQPLDVVVLELSLAGHSGMEFLYEFRSYPDWAEIPVLVYSTIVLDPLVIQSRSWQKLGVSAYLYKPDSSLDLLKKSIEKVALAR